VSKFPRYVTIVAAGLVAMQLTGCANMKLGAPVADIQTTAQLRSAGLSPANVGTFTPAAGKIAELDRGTTVRGNPLSSSIEGSFAQYLRESVKVELDAAGLYDAKSGAIVTGTLTESELDAAMGQGTGALAARFVVTRGGAVRYDRELKETSTWKSSFLGAVAIPAAASEYETLYRKLVKTLMADAAFRTALKQD
jgi:outer membrane lipoprotein SlyB